jgi:hypothetical protein
LVQKKFAIAMDLPALIRSLRSAQSSLIGDEAPQMSIERLG